MSQKKQTLRILSVWTIAIILAAIGLGAFFSAFSPIADFTYAEEYNSARPMGLKLLTLAVGIALLLAAPLVIVKFSPSPREPGPEDAEKNPHGNNGSSRG